MAVGSNTLGLLFKIGVDAKDAEQQIGGLKKLFGDVGNAALKGLGEGAVQGAKDFEKAMATSQGAFSKFGNQVNQARAGIENVFRGDVIEGTINLTRQLGPLGIALAGVAAAAAAVGFAIKGAIDAAHEIGTTSKEDFDALQKKVQSAGQSITELQRGMAQGVLEALDKISGAVTAFFAKVLERDGPAIIALLTEIANFITQTMIPLVDKWGGKIEDIIVNTIALWRTLNHEFTAGEWLSGLQALDEVFAKNVADVRKEIAAIHPHAAALVETTKARKKATEDLTQAQLEQNRAQRELDEAQADAAAQRAEIDRQLKLGVITAEEAAGRRLAIEQNIRNLEDALLDAQKKRIEAEVKGEKARTDALEENASKRTILEKKAAAEQAAINAQQNKDQIKQDEDRLKRIDKILEAEEKLNAIIKERARAAQEIPGGGVAGGDRGLAPIPGVISVTDALKQLPKPIGGFLDELGTALTQSGDMFTTWGDLAKGALTGVAGAAKQTLAAFILTGKGGALAFKQLAADIIATLVVQAAVKAIFELAEGFAALFLNPPAAAAHFKAAALYGIVATVAGAAAAKIGASGGLAGNSAAAAGGAGGFGGAAAPGAVTINQGTGATTLGIAAQQLGLMTDMRNSLSNITTAPPGDVLQRGVDQNPLAVGHGVNEAGRRDGTVTRQFLEIAGLRPA